LGVEEGRLKVAAKAVLGVKSKDLKGLYIDSLGAVIVNRGPGRRSARKGIDD
jgi:hypothetical protein